MMTNEELLQFFEATKSTSLSKKKSNIYTSGDDIRNHTKSLQQQVAEHHATASFLYSSWNSETCRDAQFEKALSTNPLRNGNRRAGTRIFTLGMEAQMLNVHDEEMDVKIRVNKESKNIKIKIVNSVDGVQTRKQSTIQVDDICDFIHSPEVKTFADDSCEAEFNPEHASKKILASLILKNGTMVVLKFRNETDMIHFWTVLRTI